MTEQEAFEDWYLHKCTEEKFGASIHHEAWQSALEWARSQQEPVAWVRKDLGHLDFHKHLGYLPLYTTPPAEQVNGKLLEALKDISVNGFSSFDRNKAKAAIEVAERGQV